MDKVQPRAKNIAHVFTQIKFQRGHITSFTFETLPRIARFRATAPLSCACIEELQNLNLFVITVKHEKSKAYFVLVVVTCLTHRCSLCLM